MYICICICILHSPKHTCVYVYIYLSRVSSLWGRGHIFITALPPPVSCWVERRRNGPITVAVLW